jgi:glycosyltransferase involved in cell wall biosynthesis
LAIVGDVAVELAPTLLQLIDNLGLADRVVLTSRIDPAEYESWLRRADIAVQLRRASNGEVSAAVGDCLRFGIPTAVTALGTAADLPDAAVIKVAPDADANLLAAAIRNVIADPDERKALAANSLDYVRSRDFDRAARRLLDAVGLGPDLVQRPVR